MDGSVFDIFGFNDNNNNNNNKPVEITKTSEYLFREAHKTFPAFEVPQWLSTMEDDSQQRDEDSFDYKKAYEDLLWASEIYKESSVRYATKYHNLFKVVKEIEGKQSGRLQNLLNVANNHVSVLNDNNRIVQENARLMESLEDLASDNVELSNKLNAANAENRQLAENVRSLTANSERLTEENKQIRGDNEELAIYNDELSDRLDEAETEIKQLQEIQKTLVEKLNQYTSTGRVGASVGSYSQTYVSSPPNIIFYGSPQATNVPIISWGQPIFQGNAHMG
jgi:uncharacterized phage infection (PIP) family protein YhgE